MSTAPNQCYPRASAPTLAVLAGREVFVIGVLSPRYRWLAQDADGNWYAYETHPVANLALNFWDSPQRCMYVGKGEAPTAFNCTLRDLHAACIPGVPEVPMPAVDGAAL